MGLFSDNRISSIAAIIKEDSDETEVTMPDSDSEEASDPEAEVNNESAEENNEPEETAPEIDDEVLSMMDDEDDYNYNIDEGFCGLLETCINIDENDSAMFNALLRLDFASIIKEKTIIGEAGTSKEGNEKKCSKINANIEKVCIGAKKSIESATNKVSNKTGKLVEKDKNLNTKYGDVLDMKNLEGFPGIKNFKFPNKNTIEASMSVSDVTTVISAASKTINAIKKANDKDGIESAIKSFVVELDELGDKFKEDIHKAMKSNEVWTPNATDIKVIKAYMNGKLGQKSMKLIADKTNAGVAKVEKEAKAAVASCCDGNEIGTYKVNKIYFVTSATMKILMKKVKVAVDLSIIEMSSLRKALIICGNYALKKSKGKKASMNEEVIFDFCESCDLYVIDHFEEEE